MADLVASKQVTAPQRGLLARRSRFNKEGRAALFFLLPNIVGFLVFSVIPVVASFIMSFYDWDLLFGAQFIGLQNYIKLFQDDLFRTSLFNTFYFAIVSVPLTVIVSLGVAALANLPLRGMAIFRSIFLLPYVTLTVAVAVVWKWLFLPDVGLINQALGFFGIDGPSWLVDPRWAMPALILMSVWKSFGYNMVLFLAGLQGIPQNLYEAARIDGASAWQRFRYITIPMLSPVTFFVVVISTIGSFQVFDQAIVMTNGGPGTATTTLVLHIYQVGFQAYRMGYAAAIAWVLFAIIFVFTIIQFRAQRRFVTYE